MPRSNSNFRLFLRPGRFCRAYYFAPGPPSAQARWAIQGPPLATQVISNPAGFATPVPPVKRLAKTSTSKAIRNGRYYDIEMQPWRARTYHTHARRARLAANLDAKAK